MKKVFIIVYENELEFGSGSDIVGNRFVKSKRKTRVSLLSTDKRDFFAEVAKKRLTQPL